MSDPKREEHGWESLQVTNYLPQIHMYPEPPILLPTPLDAIPLESEMRGSKPPPLDGSGTVSSSGNGAPESPRENGHSGSNGGRDKTSPTLAHRFLRPSLRQATMILPRTGERVKRQVTLRIPRRPNADDEWEQDEVDGEGSAEDEPLMARGGSREQGRWFRVLRQRVVRASVERGRRLVVFAGSKTGQGIFKCSLAYLLGSMATFVPPIAGFLGVQDGKHIVATVTVYFHPARSQGSMHEAIFLALLAFVYAAFVSVASMGISVGFDAIGLRSVGLAIVLVVFCGGGLGLVGWLKQRLDNPLVNVACSLTSLAIITVLTKEGDVQSSQFSDDKIQQVLKMVVMGVVATSLVSLAVKPVSARKELRETMIRATDSLGDMLSLITKSFLEGSAEQMHAPSFVAASDTNKAVFRSLTKNLKEARNEHYVYGTEREYEIEARLTHCMQRLSQSIGGLRSAAMMQFDLLSQALSGGTDQIQINPTKIQRGGNNLIVPVLPSPTTPPISQERFGILAAINEDPEGEDGSPPTTGKSDGSHLPNVNSAVDVFERFIMQLGPAMKSLAYTLQQILDELPFGPGPEYHVTVNNQFRTSLVDAIELYAKASGQALDQLYQKKHLDTANSVAVAADFEEVAASCGYFSYTLHDFAEETLAYLNLIEELRVVVEEPKRSWRWFMFWRKKSRRGEHLDLENSLIDHNAETQLPQASHELAHHQSLEELFSEKADKKQRALGYQVWNALRFLRREDIKFALKVGLGAALYALPSFISASRPFYSRWRGEWGLLSYMLVCSMTIGASNTTSFARFMGTCIGAVGAIVSWVVSRGNPFGLAALGWLMSLFCFYIILAQGRGPMGRFILLTYNLSALYAYSLSVADDGDEDEDEGGENPEIVSIALHRVSSVMVGCLWGLVITRVIWPISAQRKFKDGLSLLWLRMGLIWKRDPMSILIEGEPSQTYMDLREEFELQRFVSRLDNLRNAASSELDLRGPFPNSQYATILKSTGRMLDAFHAMNVIILKDLNGSDAEMDMLKYTAEERAYLCARISHLYQVLASSMKLEYPLNDALPKTENARDRLLARVFSYRKTYPDTADKDFALLYAYALVTAQLSREIVLVSAEIEKLFGVLSEDMLKLQ